MQPDTITAICAIVVAVLALAVSLWQTSVTRRHNRLSVTPLLRFERISLRDRPVSIDLLNAGLGPAVIKKFEIGIGSETLQNPEKSKLEEVLVRAGLEAYHISGYKPGKDDAIPSGERRSIVSVEVDSERSGVIERVAKILKKISIRIEYESIYKEHQSPAELSDEHEE